MMLSDVEELTVLLAQSGLAGAAYRRSKSIRSCQPAPMVAGGEDRYDNLMEKAGEELWLDMRSKRWRAFGKKLCTLADEIRFQIFESREHAVAAGESVLVNALKEVGYRVRRGRRSEDFGAAVRNILRMPEDAVEKLENLIRLQYKRPRGSSVFSVIHRFLLKRIGRKSVRWKRRLRGASPGRRRGSLEELVDISPS
jgi:hypothetical protein